MYSLFGALDSDNFKKRQRTASVMVAELEALVQDETIVPMDRLSLNDKEYNQYVHYYMERQAAKSGSDSYDLLKGVYGKKLRTEFKLDVLANILSETSVQDDEQLAYLEDILKDLKRQEQKGYLGKVLKGKEYTFSRSVFR